MKAVSNIVFTRNRPLQLEAYLRSLYTYFPAELIQTYVLYKFELFDDDYHHVFKKFPDSVVIKETDFAGDFLGLLNELDTKYILFGVDDVVYFDSVDFNVIEECFTGFDGDIFGFSLRFGAEGAREAGDTVNESLVAGRTVYSIDWTRGRTPISRYPFELCATLYPTDLVRAVVANSRNNNPIIRSLFSPASALTMALGKIISARRILKSFGYFFSPNTLESWNCRWCQNHADQLPHLLCFQKQCAGAVQVNTVNTSTAGRSDDSADYTIEALAEKYRQGYRMDIDFVAENKPTGAHCGRECFKFTVASG